MTAGVDRTGATARSASLRDLVTSCVKAHRAILVPGAANALSARVIADLGFEAVYVTGAGVTNMDFGLPDFGFLNLSKLAEHTAAIRDAVGLPLIVDIDTGFGNAMNVYQTTRMLERAGANAIQIEDQVSPKRCGHFAGKSVISTAEMVGKLDAAVDARTAEDLLIIARTDAREVEGLPATIDRAHAYIEAGADLTFVEALESLEEMQRVPELLKAPQVINMVVGGKTPIVGVDDLSTMGFTLVLYANAALQGAILGMQNALRELQQRGQLDETSATLVSFAERQRLVRKPMCDDLELRYSSDRLEEKTGLK